MQPHKRHLPALFTLITSLCAINMAAADSQRSRCGYSNEQDREPDSYSSCVFSQRQGYISIYAGEETLHEFAPRGEGPGNFTDAQGRQVYRKAGLGDRGQLFQLDGRYLYVLWDPAPSALSCSGDELAKESGCKLGDGNVGFALQATRGSSLNSLVITPIGLEIDNRDQTFELDGTAYLAELADLDADGWPEVYVYVSSAGSGSYGSLVALAVNNGKSATPIHLQPMSTPCASEGYQGHDAFRVVENRLVRRYPLYREGDTNAGPTGGTRQVQYRLEAGEAGWQLVEDQIVDYAGAGDNEEAQ